MQSLTINITPLRHVVVFHMLYVYFIFVSYTFTGSTLHVSINPSHSRQSECTDSSFINPLNAELNPICYLLALLGAHHFLHVSRIKVKSLTLRQLISYIYIYIYIYMEHLFLIFLDHTQRRTTVGRTPLDE